MGRTLNEVIAAMPPEQQARVEARAAHLIAEEMTLRDLRKAFGKTQEQLAKRLNKPQAAISRMEAQGDMLISSLDRVVSALGGRVRIVAEMPNHAPIELMGLGDIGAVGARSASVGPRARAMVPVMAKKRQPVTKAKAHPRKAK